MKAGPGDHFLVFGWLSSSLPRGRSLWMLTPRLRDIDFMLYFIWSESVLCFIFGWMIAHTLTRTRAFLTTEIYLFINYQTNFSGFHRRMLGMTWGQSGRSTQPIHNQMPTPALASRG